MAGGSRLSRAISFVHFDVFVILKFLSLINPIEAGHDRPVERLSGPLAKLIYK